MNEQVRPPASRTSAWIRQQDAWAKQWLATCSQIKRADGIGMSTTVEESRALALQVLIRLAALQTMVARGWVTAPSGERFFDWWARPSGHSLHQKLNLLFEKAMVTPIDEVRRQMGEQVGLVPYLGQTVIGRAPHVDLSPFLLPDESILGAVEAVPPEHEEWFWSKPQALVANLFEEGSKLSSTKFTWGKQERNGVLVGSGAKLMQDMHSQYGDRETSLQSIDHVRVRAVHPLLAMASRGMFAVYAMRYYRAPRSLPDLDTCIAWRPSPLSELEAMIIPPEGQRVEYKASLEWDLAKQTRSKDHLISALRAVCGFLNTEGGTLYLGVADDGQPVGLVPELSAIRDEHPHDVYRARFRESLKNFLDPVPLNHVVERFEVYEGSTVLVAEVYPAPHVTYLIRKDGTSGQQMEEVYVRDGNRTLSLQGRKRDQFFASRLG